MNDWDDVIHSLNAGPIAGPVLFKRTTVGEIQQWQMERLGDKYRTIHGRLGGNLVTSEWTVCIGKNIGKKNETSPEKQAELEVEAQYKKKQAQGKYFDSLSDIDKITFVSPMLAQPFNEKKLGDKFGIQPKLDGVRCIATKNGLFSRQGKPFPAMRHIAESLQPLFDENPDLILDGELYNHKYKADFQELISVIKQTKPTEEDFEKAKQVVNYHVYDIAITEHYEARLDEIYDLLQMDSHTEKNDGPMGTACKYNHVFIVDIWDHNPNGVADIESHFEELIHDGYEGAIIRNLNAPYESKRTYQLMKYKKFIDAEFEVADILEGEGNWSGHAKIALLWIPGVDRSSGIIRTGKDRNVFGAGIKGAKGYAKRLLEAREDVIGSMATVTYFRLTDDGIPYLPIFKVIRDYE